MLSDSRIERYSRQILLPEIGSRGQERLLAATVGLRGAGDPLRLCAAWLAGAGVGRLAVIDDEPARSSPALVPETLFRDRNPDSVPSAAPVADSDVAVFLGGIPDAAPSGIVLCGAASSGEVRWARFAAGRACAGCAAAALSREGGANARDGLVLGTVLALETLAALLGLRDAATSELSVLDPGSGGLERRPFPFRPGCCA